ncbi:Averantin hydroxylase [Colletotrichum sp. SAR11_59]|nr:Averantin hydroxylase [Colletotrichum sp. SAR11_59]
MMKATLTEPHQISGIITLPVAIYGYFFFPDTPSTTTAFYLSEEEIKLAQERVPIREEGEKILTWSFISRILHSWYFYGFCFLWILGNTSESQSNQSLLNLYMQSHPTEHYTVFQRNNYPTGVQAVGVVSTLLWATTNAAIILAPTTTAAKFGAYYWAGSIYCIQATFFAWANDSMRNESPALRACVIACMNAAGNCFQAWWPLIFFRADDALEFRKGMIAMIAVGTAMMIWVTVLIFMDRRLSKKQIQVIEAVDADSHAEAGLSAPLKLLRYVRIFRTSINGSILLLRPMVEDSEDAAQRRGRFRRKLIQTSEYLGRSFGHLSPTYFASVCIYNLFFHPLSKYPGPRLAAATPLWLVSAIIGGRQPEDTLKLHEKYGSVVRTSPNGLSYSGTPQWKEIYTPKAGQLEFAKDQKFFAGFRGRHLILNADRRYHPFIRKLLAPGFSEKAMREQEAVLKEFVDLMFRRVQEDGQNGTQPVDILKWFNFLTFDFIGFLTFGQSFDCLTTSTLHMWVKMFLSLAKFFAYYQAISYSPLLLRFPVGLWLFPLKVLSDAKTLTRLQEEMVNHRLEIQPTVPDFMDKMIAAYKSGKMSYDQLEGNSQLLIAGGSETTSTHLAGLVWLLMTNPRVLEKLSAEIRTAFAHEGEITFAGVNDCKYLLACIEEGLRIYPPSPQAHNRIVPPGGATIDGEFIPEANWTRPNEFIPERWLGEDPEFAGDKRDASQPFLLGPRMCVGRNLAYAEIKVIIARLVCQFDIENVTKEDWMDQKVFMAWEKMPLWIKLHPVRR